MTTRERAVICNALAYSAEHKGGTTAELAEMWDIQRRLTCEPVPKPERWLSYGGKRHTLAEPYLRARRTGRAQRTPD